MMNSAADALGLTCGGLSDVGVKRANNEDAFAIATVGRPWARGAGGTVQPLPEAGVLLAVSDGLGGNNAGEVASWLAVETLHRVLGERHGAADAAAQLRAAVVRTDAAVREGGKVPGHAGMGATLSALWFQPGRAWIGHVGDSRIYRWRAGQLQQLTTDHSAVGRMRQAGEITEEQARHHRFRSMIEQSLGGDLATFAPDIFAVEPAAGDVFLLCSDGLTDGLRDEQLAQHLVRAGAGAPPADVCRDLIVAAKTASGRDNITAIVARLHAARPPSFLRRLLDEWRGGPASAPAPAKPNGTPR